MATDFTNATLHRLLKGRVGDKITDVRCPGLAARLLKSGITFEWRGRIKGKPQVITIRLAMWSAKLENVFRSADGSSVKREGFEHLALGGLAALPPTLTIAEARAVATVITAYARKGRDVRQTIRAPAELTLARAIDRYQAEHQKHLRRGKQVIANLRRYLAEHFDTPIVELTKRDLLDSIRVLTDADQWSQAHRVRADASGLFNWLEDQEIVPGYTSVARRLKLSRPAPVRDYVPSLPEIREIYANAEHLGIRQRVLVRLLVLGVFRLAEVANLRWSEVSEDVITIPAARYKTKREFRQPLTETMTAELALLPRTGPKVLGAIGNFSAIVRAVRPAGSSCQFHDLRRGAATHLAEVGIEFPVIEKLLGHALRGVMATYNRSRLEGQVRQALELWGQMITSGVVVPIRRTG